MQHKKFALHSNENILRYDENEIVLRSMLNKTYIAAMILYSLQLLEFMVRSE